VYIRLNPDSYKDLIGTNKRFPFRPGMSASADIQTKTHVNVLSIPINAVTTREKNDSTLNKDMSNPAANDGLAVTNQGDNDLDVVVFVLQPDGKVKKQKVKTDIQDINYIEVTDGLKEGQEVISGPYDVVSKTLKDGDKVKVVPKSELFSKK
jgi:HlyD family secretion protein